MSYYMRGRIDKQVIGYFKENGAISPETAIIPDIDELRKRINATPNYNINLASWDFLFSVEGGSKYYFNNEFYSKKASRAVLMSFGVVLFVLIVLVLISLL